jgi:hypothetical protein
MKKYKKPGQIYKTPAKDDPLRRFYRSLHRQKKDSVMAKKWLLEHGLFSTPKATKIIMFLELEKLSLQ